MGTVDYPPIQRLPACVDLLQLAVNTVRATAIGRVMAVRLFPGGAIDPHWDAGGYAATYSRFHLVLESQEGNRFLCGDEQVHMLPGELWWFNHREQHQVFNDSAAWRTHLIIDLATPDFQVATGPA